MQPAYQVTIDGKIIDFAGRLVSLSVTERTPDRMIAEVSNSVEIVLEDTRSDRLALPERGRELKVMIGYLGQPLVDKGTFIVDEVEVDGPPTQLIIRAQSNPKSPHDEKYNSLTTRQSRSFPSPLSIQKLVEAIAQDHNLQPVVGPSLAAVQLTQVDQTNESDADVLWRIAQLHDATIKIQDGKLIFIERGTGQSANGLSLPNLVVTVADGPIDPTKVYLTKWNGRFSDFITYETAVAVWRDVANARDVEEQVGSGAEPTLRLTNIYPNAADALAAAKTALVSCDRRAGEVSATFPGNPSFEPEGTITFENVREGLDGSWYITESTHQISREGYTTTVRGNRFSADALSEANE